MKRRRHLDDEAEINITPMLDIVFIMLIFFIVTTSFVKEKGLELSRPSNSPPQELAQDKGPIVVRIDSGSLISLKGVGSSGIRWKPTWNGKRPRNPIPP